MQSPPLSTLESRCNADWRHLREARERAQQKLAEVGGLSGMASKNVAVVVLGSFARQELTKGSDIDWFLLVDGPSDPEDYRIASDVGEQFTDFGLNPPGTMGTFGTMVSSHELIHYIGGRQDSNVNLTRRMLLLLESLPVGDGDVVHNRVIRNVLKRYLVYDASVSGEVAARDGRLVPRYLLNDIVRFWRTMAVDYAAKRWEQADKKWAIRNAKLRFSRKLLLVSGLLLCFSREFGAGSFGEVPEQQVAREGWLLEAFASQVATSPLDRLAQAFLACEGSACDNETARKTLGSYDAFIGILADSESRSRLEGLPFDAAENDDLFREVRRLSRDFQAGLTSLFFDSPVLAKLVREYGLF